MTPLYIITTVFNPKEYKSRIKLFNDFKRRVLNEREVHLIVIEAIFRNNPPQIKQTKNKRLHVFHIKARSELWLKENLINIAIKKLYKLDPSWKYVSMIDADLAFVRPDWVVETKRLLNEFPIIQMFTNISQLNRNYQIMSGFGLGFVEGWDQELAFKNKTISKEDPGKVRYGWCGAPGGAWAYTRECIDEIFPLYDVGIVGSGDYIMAVALMGYAELTFTTGYTIGYIKSILEWQKRVYGYINGRVGKMTGLILHYWHGSIRDRGYDTRWQLLVKHKFDPYTDLLKTKKGLYYLTPDKPEFIKDIENYFLNRKEDL